MILEKVGVGGQAIVYKAKNVESNQIIAVKSFVGIENYLDNDKQ